MTADHVLTPRLQLDAVVPEDLNEHYALLSDPGVWAHLPSGVHTDRGRTADGVAAAVAHWASDGLGYWTARLRTDLAADQAPPGLGPGAGIGIGIGIGGCAVRAGTD
jgi:RimJ/RimL family protein N-acetyltransferase